MTPRRLIMLALAASLTVLVGLLIVSRIPFIRRKLGLSEPERLTEGLRLAA